MTTIEADRPRVTDLAVSLIQAGVIVVGTPLFLTIAVGWPLPSAMPTWAAIQRAYQLRDIPDRLVIGGLACALWLWWAMVIITLIAGIVARVRSVAFRRPTLVLPAVHGIVGRWISVATLAITLLSKPAGATTIPARSVIATTTQPMRTDTTTRPTLVTRADVPPVAPPHNGAGTRTIVTGEHQTYWDIAEATLGDGNRWREIADANPDLGKIDLLPSGVTITIPTQPVEHDHTVIKGDNLWRIAAHELRDAHQGQRPTNAQIVPYWRDVIDTNEADLRSRDPNLIYPGETITLPTISDDQRPDSTVEGSAGDTSAPSSSAPTASPLPDEVTVTTVAPVRDVAPPAAMPSDPQEEPLDDVDIDFTPLWIAGIALTGIGAAGVLTAWHRQRRRRIRDHRSGAPITLLTHPDRELISQLRGLADDQHLTAVDTALRYLAAKTAEHGTIPSVSLVRAGHHTVELLRDDMVTPTPDGFVHLDQKTIIINPATPAATIDDMIAGRVNPAPALVSIGQDDVGTVLVDLERTQALALEAARPEDAIGVALAILTELASHPWAASCRVLTYGLPAAIDPDRRITAYDDPDALLDAAEAHLQAQTDDTLAHGSHTQRSVHNHTIEVLVVLLGPGNAAIAHELSCAARLPGSAIALVACDPLTTSPWRLVLTADTATLEPPGIGVRSRTVIPTALDPQANEQLRRTFGPSDGTEPADPEPSTDAVDHEMLANEMAHQYDAPDADGAEVESPHDGLQEPTEEVFSTSSDDPDEAGVDSDDAPQTEAPSDSDVPDVDGSVDADDDDTYARAGDLGEPIGGPGAPDRPKEPDGLNGAASPAVRWNSHADAGARGQLQLLTVADDRIGENLLVDAFVRKVLTPKPVEIVLLDGAPRIEGVQWNGKESARGDEIVVFLAVNGPSTLAEVAAAMWPDKARPGDTARQLVSRARKVLGTAADGNPRLSNGTRSAPYRLHDVGCDWHRFEQLTDRAERTTDDNERRVLLKSAIALVRRGPFESCRVGAFDWATDLCFDSRMRLRISEATRTYETLVDDETGVRAQEIRQIVTYAE